jgi:hypothetical protein
MNDLDEFYTETLAKLYLKQGHIDKAATVYQSLIKQFPERHDLKEAFAKIQTGIETSKTTRRQAYLGNLIYRWLRLLLYLKHHQRLQSLNNRAI